MDPVIFDFTSEPEETSPIPPELAAILAVLRSAALFGSLDDAELESVARCVVESSVGEGGIVIRQGEEGCNLYLVASGRLSVECDKDGRQLVLGEVGPGEAFGELSLIAPAPTSATVTVTEGARLLAIGRLDLEVLLNWNPVLAAKMWRSFTQMLAERLRDTNERMVEQFGR